MGNTYIKDRAFVVVNRDKGNNVGSILINSDGEDKFYRGNMPLNLLDQIVDGCLHDFVAHSNIEKLEEGVFGVTGENCRFLVCGVESSKFIRMVDAKQTIRERPLFRICEGIKLFLDDTLFKNVPKTAQQLIKQIEEVA